MKTKGNFSFRLIKARKFKGLTQKQAAGVLGISEPTMNHYETGKRSPSVETLLRLANILKCDAGWLLTGRGTAPDGTASKSSPPVEPASNDFVYVPKYDVQEESSPRSLQSGQVVDHLAFRRSWVEQELQTSPEQLLLIQHTGDAMTPTLNTGDLLLVDRAWKTPGDGIYLLDIAESLYVRRLVQQIDGGLVVRGDNPAAAAETHLSPDAEDRLTVVGRIVWVGRRI